MTTNTHAEPQGFTHCALFYRDQHDYVDVVVPFVIDGLDMGQPVLIGVPPDNAVVVREALGAAAAEVTMADMAELGRNPARMMGAMSAFAAEHSDRPVRMVGEPVWPGRTADEYPGCVENEALSNALFRRRSVTALCPYDASRLDEGMLADARATHPLVWNGDAAARCDDYAPDDALTRHNRPLPSSTVAATYTVRTVEELAPARSFAARYARWLALSLDRLADLQLIATELATNSLRHAASACRLAFWEYNGHMVCEAKDSGRLDDRLAGRRAPNAESTTGCGLFLVNAVADLVRTYATPTGTTIQAYLRLSPSSR